MDLSNEINKSYIPFSSLLGFWYLTEEYPEHSKKIILVENEYADLKKIPPPEKNIFDILPFLTSPGALLYDNEEREKFKQQEKKIILTENLLNSYKK